MIAQKSDRTSVFAQYTVLLRDREAAQKVLSDIGIPTAIHYPIPINEQPAYRHLCCSDCTPISKAIAGRVMSLPMGPYLSDKAQDKIVSAILESRRL